MIQDFTHVQYFIILRTFLHAPSLTPNTQKGFCYGTIHCLPFKMLHTKRIQQFLKKQKENLKM